MDVAAKAMRDAQFPRHPHHLFHRMIGRADNAGREKQPLDIVAPIELQRQPHHLLGSKPRPLDIARRTIDAIGAIIDTEIGEQYLQERNAAPVRRIGMAYARPLRGAKSAGCSRAAFRRAAGGTGRIVFGRIGKNGQPLPD